MFTRRVITLLASLVLVVSAFAIWSAQGDERDGDTDTNVVASSGAEAGAQTASPKKKGGIPSTPSPNSSARTTRNSRA